MTWFGKEDLDEKFITDNCKYRNIKYVVETNKEECENSRSKDKIPTSVKLSRSYKSRADEKGSEFFRVIFELIRY